MSEVPNRPANMQEAFDAIEIIRKAHMDLEPAQEEYIGGAWKKLVDERVVSPEQYENWYIAACILKKWPITQIDSENVDNTAYDDKENFEQFLPLAAKAIVRDYDEAADHEIYEIVENYEFERFADPAMRAHLLRTARLFIFMQGD